MVPSSTSIVCPHQEKKDADSSTARRMVCGLLVIARRRCLLCAGSCLSDERMTPPANAQVNRMNLTLAHTATTGMVVTNRRGVTYLKVAHSVFDEMKTSSCDESSVLLQSLPPLSHHRKPPAPLLGCLAPVNNFTTRHQRIARTASHKPTVKTASTSPDRALPMVPNRCAKPFQTECTWIPTRWSTATFVVRLALAVM